MTALQEDRKSLAPDAERLSRQAVKLAYRAASKSGDVKVTNGYNNESVRTTQ